MDITVRKLNQTLEKDFFCFFDNNAFSDHKEWSGCYCMFYHMTDEMRAENEKRGVMNNREYAKEYIRENKLQGYLAYAEGKAVGWCNANDKHAFYGYSRENSPEVWENIPDCKTKLVTCFVIAPKYRGKGIATRLLEYIIDDAKGSGYECVEAYPLKGEHNSFEHYHGPLVLYKKLGFETVGETERMYIARKLL